MADTTERQRELIKALVANSQELDTLFSVANPAEPIPPPTPPIATMDELDRALAASLPGETLLLSTSLVYIAPLKIAVSGIRLMSETAADRTGQRMTVDEPAPCFQNGLTITGNDVTCSGLDVAHTVATTDIVVLAARHLTLDRLRILGDKAAGAKRGIAANGGDMLISNCYIDDIKRVGQDTQAICAWDMLEPGLFITNCYLGGAAQAVMLGGADPPSPDRSPSLVRITRSTLTKPQGWQTDGTQVKCAFEAKNCNDVRILDCDLIGAGISQGQGAYAIVLTPRNQGGKAPFSAITNVRIERCHVQAAGGCVTFLGTDPTAGRPSQFLDGVTITNVVFDDIDPKIYGGPGRLFTFEDAAHNVTLDGLTVHGTNIAALGYFMKRPPVLMTLRNLNLPTSRYGWKIDGGGSGIPALKAYAPDATIDLSPNDTGASVV